MERVYGFLLTTVLLLLAVLANLLAYVAVGGDFFVIGLVILLVSLVFGVFLYPTWVSQAFRILVFGITLLSGVILFPALFPSQIIVVLLIVGSFGFVLSLADVAMPKRKRRRRRRRRPQQRMAEPPMPLPVEPMFDQTTPAMQSLAVMESLDRDDEFLELDEVDKLVQEKQAAPKKATVKKRTSRKRSTKRRKRRTTKKK